MISPPLCHDQNPKTLETAIKVDPYGGAGGGASKYICIYICIYIYMCVCVITYNYIDASPEKNAALYLCFDVGGAAKVYPGPRQTPPTTQQVLIETPPIKFGKNKSARYVTCDKPGPVTPCCGRDGGVHSMKPVYGAATSGEPVTPDCGGGTATRGRSTGPLGRSRRDRGLWSLPRPPDRLVGRTLSPRAAESTGTRSRLWGAKRDHL
jgi:hypothetical protein